MDRIARTYVHLVLAVGQHDPNYVDAYYGQPEWKAPSASLPEIREQALAARADLGAPPASGLDEISTARWRSLGKQLDALIARVRMLSGERFTFDEESAALYDVVDPGRPDSFYDGVLAKLDSLLPGNGSVGERFEELRADFYVPKEKLDEVFRAAIEAAREKTKRYIALPEGEDFRLEYVSGEVWSAYNWYKGNAQSLIQVNTDFPLSIDRALGLACHEGYPGHHVYNVLLERHLVRERNWVEFTVYPLYSPQSLIAEGTAEYGVGLSFPPAERLAFEQEVLFPLAGLDPGRAPEYAQVLALIEQLGYASNDAARRYLDGEATKQETIDWLVRYALSTPERAAQRVRFFEAHRSYVVTYNVGQDLLKNYIESHAHSAKERWSLFARLLSSPQTPSGLAS
jgi:hypothetical protein